MADQMKRCGYKWLAPLAAPRKLTMPGYPEPTVTSVPQECVIAVDHKGPHRSLSNVITDRRPA